MLHGQPLSAVHRKRKRHVRQDGRVGQLEEYHSYGNVVTRRHFVGPWETGLQTWSKFNVLITFRTGLGDTNVVPTSTVYGIFLTAVILEILGSIFLGSFKNLF
jgi:hypothetical protein